MKKSIFLIALFIGFSSLVIAQKRGSEMSPYMAEKLNLTEEQQQELKEIREVNRKDFEALKDKRLTVDERKAEMKALREKMNEQVESVLSREQMDTWKSMRKEHRNRGFENRMDRKRELGSLLIDLDLSDDQKSKIKELMDARRPKMEEIRNSEMDRETKMKQMRVMRDKTHQELESILSPEQFKIVQERLEKRSMMKRHEKGPQRLKQ
jgi:Spy/CpxP family protein refolding chaperone